MLPKATPREELLTNLRAAYARMWVRLRGSNREITGLVAEIGLPILTIGAYVILYRAIGLPPTARSEEHTSELQSQSNLVCRLLLEKKKKHYAARPRIARIPSSERALAPLFERARLFLSLSLLPSPLPPRAVALQDTASELVPSDQS